MRNGISLCALSEYANEVREDSREALLRYEIKVDWETGTRARVTPGAMVIGAHKIARKGSWKVDEPRQLLGTNAAPNPQEYLLTGLASCLMVAYVAGATTQGVQLDSLLISVRAELDLHAFLGIHEPISNGFSVIHYEIRVSGDARPQQFEEIRRLAEQQSPNAATLKKAVELKGQVICEDSSQC